ncbi:hypothetical protein [Micrococcus sp. IITD107]|uniref:hypothetical protein n=1 Tax=Micrococcus sp. IITD107 TaxID=3342790 RepID=UPI0035B9226C
MPDICIVSGGDEIRYRSYVNHAAYARTHDLDYRLECGIGEGIVNKFYYKITAIERVLPRYDWVVWVDDDCYFTDFDSNALHEFFCQAEADGDFLVIAEGPVEPNGFWSTINTGVFALRRGPDADRLLTMMRDMDVPTVERAWNSEADGTFTGGDQDVMTWALKYGEPELWDRTRVVGFRELNARPHHYSTSLKDAFICHFAGYPDKTMGVILFAERFNVGHELVPEDILDRLSVKVRSPMSTAELAARRAWWTARPKAKRAVRTVLRALPEPLVPQQMRRFR